MMCKAFILRMDHCVFSMLPLDFGNAVVETQEKWKFLFLRMNHCIFSTLPLDVENTVIHTQSLKVEIVGYRVLCVFRYVWRICDL